MSSNFLSQEDEQYDSDGYQEEIPKKKQQNKKKIIAKAEKTTKKQPKVVKQKLNKAPKKLRKAQPHQIQDLVPLAPTQYQKLVNCVDVPIFSLSNQTQLIKILDVHDGDSMTGAMFINKNLYKYKFRLGGIDAPQVKDKNEIIKNFGLKVRDILSALKGKIVKGELGNFDKYGRLLVRILLKTEDSTQIDLSQWLINNKLVKAYGGKQKSVFTVQDFNNVKDTIQKRKLQKIANY